MGRLSPFLWLMIFILILLPPAGGRLILDIAGGLIFTLIAIPFVLSGVGWIGWRILQSKMSTCEVCGAKSFNTSIQCPMCGSISTDMNESVDASSATIDITVEDNGKKS